jgi:hypothetical protein
MLPPLSTKVYRLYSITAKINIIISLNLTGLLAVADFYASWPSREQC